MIPLGIDDRPDPTIPPDEWAPVVDVPEVIELPESAELPPLDRPRPSFGWHAPTAE